jgi:hypothetical protein
MFYEWTQIGLHEEQETIILKGEEFLENHTATLEEPGHRSKGDSALRPTHGLLLPLGLRRLWCEDGHTDSYDQFLHYVTFPATI